MSVWEGYPSFVELATRGWVDFPRFALMEETKLREDVDRIVGIRDRLRRALSREPAFRRSLRRFSEEGLARARELLSRGRVLGVDGTIAVYPTAAGAKVRIGIVVVSYRGRELAKSIFVSDLLMLDRELLRDPVRALEELERRLRPMRLLYRALMLYKEREYALMLDHDYALVHGPLVPFSSQVFRLGYPGFEDAVIQLLELMLRDRRVVAVISETSRLRLFSFGALLEPGEYLQLGEAAYMMRPLLRWARRHASSRLRELLFRVASEFWLGVYRVGIRPYLFMAHKDFFDEAAHIIAADASSFRLRGFPLLLDFADEACRRLFPASALRQRIERLLISKYGRLPVLDIAERRLRPPWVPPRSES